jgi:hypothetical protein
MLLLLGFAGVPVQNINGIKHHGIKIKKSEPEFYHQRILKKLDQWTHGEPEIAVDRCVLCAD